MLTTMAVWSTLLTVSSLALSSTCGVVGRRDRQLLFKHSRRILLMASEMHSPSSLPQDREPYLELTNKKCVPCESKDLRPMSEKSAKDLLPQVPGWTIVDVNGKLHLHRSWKAKSFLRGLEFFKHVAEIAEAEGHHPDLHLVGWNNISVDISTHSIGGLTENDFILAAKIGALDASDLFRKSIPKSPS